MGKAKILVGDVREMLQTLPANSVHCVVTSPPYWGLRDYGVDGQMGLEPSLKEFISNMVDVFRGVKRVLRDDGVLWLNMGDAYAQAGGKMYDENERDKSVARAKERGYNVGAWGASVGATKGIDRAANTACDGLKPKDLIGQPWRLAMALQDDGWWLRSDCIWHKPNPMPERITDRPTKSHEYVFLMTKRAKYFYDAEGVREPHKEPWRGMGEKNSGTPKIKDRLSRDTWVPKQIIYNPAGRNLRTVWTIPTEPFPGSHFATFPKKLVEKCIFAGSSEKGCCAGCGMPWVRVVEPSEEYKKLLNTGMPTKKDVGDSYVYMKSTIRATAEYITKEWRKQCNCNSETIPCTVLDPFSGSGTTGVVALRYGRDYIGIELNPKYAEMSKKRIFDDQPLFNEVEMVK